MTRRPTRERAQLRLRLVARSPEIKQAILTRLYGIADPGAADPTYLEGLRSAVSAAIEYGLEGIERGEGDPPPVPLALLTQAQLAARSGVSLDTVLRRYVAGHSVLNDLLLEESAGALEESERKQILRKQASLLDHLIAGVSEEYARAKESRPETPERRRTEQVRRLLDGELVETAPLSYDFECLHLAVVAVGSGAIDAIRSSAAEFDQNLLAVRPEQRVLWAWLGARKGVDPAVLKARLAETRILDLAVALGEPAQGLGGWRFTHRQATACLPIAQRGKDPVVRYAEVALVASTLKDDVLIASLTQLYLTPLQGMRDEGVTARKTLRAYFAAARNVSSAAAALGVKRHTVTKRLREIEARLNRPLATCVSELELALRVEELRVPLPRL